MATQAQILANQENARTTGLFTSADFIRPEEQTQYDLISSDTFKQLSPQGPIEFNYAAEILSANWRLRRCRLLECESGLTDERQKSIDRARSHAHRILHQSIAELRHLQTERQCRNEIYPAGTPLDDLGLSKSKEVSTAVAQSCAARILADKVADIDLFNSAMSKSAKRAPVAAPVPATQNSFCKTPETTENKATEGPATAPHIARNSLCPCQSGQKYKRCCGITAPPVLGKAA